MATVGVAFLAQLRLRIFYFMENEIISLSNESARLGKKPKNNMKLTEKDRIEIELNKNNDENNKDNIKNALLTTGAIIGLISSFFSV